MVFCCHDLRYLVCVGLMDGEVIVYDISTPSGKAVFINPSYTCKHLGCVWQVGIIAQASISLQIHVYFSIGRFDGVLHRVMIIFDFVQRQVMER